MSMMKRAYELEHPEEFAGEPEPKMTADERVDSAEFELQLARADRLIDARRLELFSANPKCHSCGGSIDTVDAASLVQLADEAGDYLVHRTERCTVASVVAMVERYFGRARKPRSAEVA